MKSIVNKTVAGVLGLTILAAQSLVLPGVATASVSTWIRGASIVPTSTTDFSSDTFKQSLRDLKATGATYVALVVPYYQSNISTIDIQNGANTPTDASLASAIDYAHSIGLAVSVKMHIESYDGQWRANINPADRDGWYNAYGTRLVHLATISQARSAELMVIGTELVRMASMGQNYDNTARWKSLIAQTRAVYSGKLTYSANSNSNSPDDNFNNEKNSIGFWSDLDYAGLSVYYGLQSDNSVAGLEGAWDYWNSTDIRPFSDKVGKPVMFVEIGYRSLTNAHLQPWNWQQSGNTDMTEQSNAYQAMFEYWNKYDYVKGMLLWDWKSNPAAGGTSNNDYTPQHKPAQDVMTKWFTTPTTPPVTTTPPSSFQTTATVNPSAPNAGSAATVTANITASGGSVQNGIVDIEIYNQANTRVFQKFVENQTINAGTMQSYTASWTPTISGTYHMSVGVFTSGWASNLYWNSNAATINVGSASTPPPTTPPPAGNQITDIWWPSDGSRVTGLQPFKAMVENLDVSMYDMFWQVDGGGLVPMGTNTTDYPHKESVVDLTNWKWKGGGPYTINFVSKDKSGVVISQKSINILTQ